MRCFFAPSMPQQVRTVMAQITGGMAHVHSRCIVHCDLKPPNIVVDTVGTVRIADFGNAAVHLPGLHRRASSRDVERYGVQEVTLWYRPLETLLGDAVLDYSVDVWSAGLILAEMASGQACHMAIGSISSGGRL
jgi:serine/threonine protein kinase